MPPSFHIQIGIHKKLLSSMKYKNWVEIQMDLALLVALCFHWMAGRYIS